MISDSTIACQLKRLNDLSENDYEAYTKYRSELRDSLCDKRHLKNVPDWLFEDELRNGKETMELNGVEQNNMGKESITILHKLKFKYKCLGMLLWMIVIE
jgi:hypothetical protein